MNIGEWPKRWAALQPDGPCITVGDLKLNKRAFNRRVNQLAHALQAQGVKKGDRVAVLMGNGNVFLELLFAISKLGGIMVPLNFRLAVPELEYILTRADPQILFYSPEFHGIVAALKNRSAGCRCYVCEAGSLGGDPDYEAWIVDRSVDEPAPNSPVGLDDPHIIMYTSGTTGKPKGAVITHGNTQWSAVNYLHRYPFHPSDVVACCAPLFHIGALCSSATPSIYMGCELVIQRFFDPSGILKLIEKHRITSMLGIPVMFLFMSKVPEFEQTDLSSVKYFMTGGSPCPESLMETYQNKGVVFTQGYGMTEASIITALLPEESLHQIGSCGKPLFHLSVKVVGPSGKRAAPGETGEVLVKGPMVMKGYWQNPDATSETIVDGWLKTGDIGFLNEAGYLYLKDRKKDMYISGGENVYPAEVEDVIMAISGVRDVGVIGIPDPKWGETGLAVVVKAPEADITEASIIAVCKGSLAGYKIPKKIVFADALPRTLSGKVLKKDLRETYKDVRSWE